MTLRLQHIQAFMRLVTALAANRERTWLKTQWRALENEVGRPVSEDEVWVSWLALPAGAR